MTDRPRGILAITSVLRTVPDVAAAVAFYQAALDAQPSGPAAALSESEQNLLGTRGQVAFQGISVGRQHLTLLQFEPPGRPYPPESTSADLWFQHCAVVVNDMDRAYAKVMAAGGRPISAGPQHLPRNTGGVTAYKFRDPFGHPMELLALPDGVGDPTWHEPSAHTIRGIDHTAISVSDLQASRDFYTALAGFEVVGQTLNEGEAQVRLDAVPEDVVDVLALAPGEAPPHLELLAYRTGTRRRLGAAPADTALSRTLATGDVDRLAERLTARGEVPRRGTWGDRPAIAFTDPDGHAWICCAA